MKLSLFCMSATLIGCLLPLLFYTNVAYTQISPKFRVARCVCVCVCVCVCGGGGGSTKQSPLIDMSIYSQKFGKAGPEQILALLKPQNWNAKLTYVNIIIN